MKSTRLFAAICAIAMIFSAASCTNEGKEQEGTAKYVFLFIGDGMGFSHIATTESYLSYKAGKLGGESLTFTQFPYMGMATSHSANGMITDSSAGGTAIACGAKTNNGAMGVDAEGQPVKSMAYDFKEADYQIGIMSNVSVNHATPGSFYAQSQSRNSYYAISRQIVSSDFEFFASSGFLDPKDKDGNAQPTDEYLEENGYAVAYGLEEFKKESEGRSKAIYCQPSSREKGPENYVIDEAEEDASLAEMLELGLEFLDDSKPFFIMCEGGDIDWAGHDNKTMPMIHNILEFDEAIEVAYEFYKEHQDETLIVITADHETGGVSVGSGAYVIDWALLENAWEEAGEKNNLSGEENYKLNRKASVGWTTGNHTGGAVPVFAIGKGAERFCGKMDNTDIKGKILNR